VLVLRDVLGLPASEVADILETSTASVNSALVRARSGFRPQRAPTTVPLPRSAQETAVVDRFVDAFQSEDARAVAAVLGDDARLSMPPEPIQCNGAAAVAAYLRARGFWGPHLRLVPTRANGQPAFGYYLPEPGGGRSRLNGLIVLSLVDDRVVTITRFHGNDLGERFGLPATEPGPTGA
jgi:RNA polymerase sigma-70 factor (ECF subfamily)